MPVLLSQPQTWRLSSISRDCHLHLHTLDPHRVSDGLFRPLFSTHLQEIYIHLCPDFCPYFLWFLPTQSWHLLFWETTLISNVYPHSQVVIECMYLIENLSVFKTRVDEDEPTREQVKTFVGICLSCRQKSMIRDKEKIHPKISGNYLRSWRRCFFRLFSHSWFLKSKCILFSEDKTTVIAVMSVSQNDCLFPCHWVVVGFSSSDGDSSSSKIKLIGLTFEEIVCCRSLSFCLCLLPLPWFYDLRSLNDASCSPSLQVLISRLSLLISL